MLACTAARLTGDFVNFIQEFAFDLLKHVIFVNLRVIARGLRRRSGNDSWGGSHGHGGGASRLGGRRGMGISEEVELHRQRLGAASLRHTEGAKVRQITQPDKMLTFTYRLISPATDGGHSPKLKHKRLYNHVISQLEVTKTNWLSARPQ